VTIPDDRTIRFALSNPHPEWPFLMALPTSTPVPRARNTGASDESEFVASGPYMVDGHGQTSTLVLTKNPNWEPGSDPIRHQYLDRIVVDFHGGSGEEQTNRLIADRGNDQYAVATAAVAPSKIEKVRTDPGLKARTGSAPTLTVDYIHINTSRVTEVKVRQALNWSFDRKAFVVAAGGTENDAHEAHPPTAAGGLPHHPASDRPVELRRDDRRRDQPLRPHAQQLDRRLPGRAEHPRPAIEWRAHRADGQPQLFAVQRPDD